MDSFAMSERINRIGQKPLLQATGDELNTLEMSFIFTAGWCKPDEQLKRLQEAMNAKQPLALGWGNGRFDGNYVIESLDSEITDTLPTGEVLALTVDVSLLETTDEPVAAAPEPSPYLNVRAA